MKETLRKIGDWIMTGRRLTYIILAVILVAVIVVCSVSVYIYNLSNKASTPEIVEAYVTITGFGENDVTNYPILIEDGDTVENIFSLKYEDIYNKFGKPLVYKNEFTSFMGEQKGGGKTFHVRIDGVFDTNLSQAYVYSGQTVYIDFY